MDSRKIGGGQRVYCNPPYGRGVADWLRKAREAKLAVFLLPARTDTKWWHEYAMKADDPRKAFGAVIGKALRPLGEGQGLIPILIALQ